MHQRSPPIYFGYLTLMVMISWILKNFFLQLILQIETQVWFFNEKLLTSIYLDEEKQKWAFRLYDLGIKLLIEFSPDKYIKDNDGTIDVEEMTNIIDTLDCIEGVQVGVVRYDENGHPVDTATAKTRAEELFLVQF